MSNRDFEGAGAVILMKSFKDDKLVMCLRNSEYKNNKDRCEEIEYPGGKVDEDDYLKAANGSENAPFIAANREWTEEVFSCLGNQEQQMSSQMLQKLMMNAMFEDVQGAKSKIRLYLVSIDLFGEVNDKSDELIKYLEKADRILTDKCSTNTAESSELPLSSIVSVDIKDMVQTLKTISNEITHPERTLKGKELMTTIAPIIAKHPIECKKFSSRTGMTTKVPLRKFNFFTLRALLQKTNYWNE